MDFKTDENGQVSMDLGEPTRRRIELPKLRKKPEEEPDERQTICPHGMEMQSIVQLVKGVDYCRDRCGRSDTTPYDIMNYCVDCTWICRKVNGYGSEAATRSGDI